MLIIFKFLLYFFTKTLPLLAINFKFLMKTFLFSTQFTLLFLCSSIVTLEANPGKRSNSIAVARKSLLFTANNGGSQAARISVADHAALDLTTAVTLEAWIKPTAFSSGIWQNTIISKENFVSGQAVAGSGYILRCGGNGQLEFSYGSGPTLPWNSFRSVENALTLNEWQHVAVSFAQNGGVHLYRNGVELSRVVTGNFSNAILPNNQALTIGGHFEYTRNFMGSIDEVRVWNVARSQTDINTYQNRLFCTTPASLVAYYPFNEMEGTTTVMNAVSNGVGNGVFDMVSGASITDNSEGQELPTIAAEINLQGNNMDILSGNLTTATSDNTNFGLTNSTTPIAKTFTIQNRSNDILIIHHIASNNSRFVVSNAPTSIAAGASEPFTVTFTSIGAGEQMATITLENNDCDEGTYSFAVKAAQTSYEVRTTPGNCAVLTHCLQLVKTSLSTDVIGLNLTIQYPSAQLTFNAGGVTCTNASVQIIENEMAPGVLKVAAYGVNFTTSDRFNVCLTLAAPNAIQGTVTMPVTVEIKESFVNSAPSMATNTDNNIVVSQTTAVETQFFYGNAHALGNSNGSRTRISECTPSAYETFTNAAGQSSIGAGKQVRITRTPAPDVDPADGIISLDARMIARISALERTTEVQNLSQMAILAADVNQDQQITAGDATLALRTSVGLRPVQYIWTDSTVMLGAAYQKSSNFPNQGNSGMWAESVPNVTSCIQMAAPACGPLTARIWGVRLGDALITESNNSQFLRGANEIIFDLNGAVRHADNTITIPFRYSDMSIALTGLDLDIKVGSSSLFTIIGINSLSGYSQEANLTDNRFRYAAFSRRGDTQANFELVVKLLSPELPKCSDFVASKALINGVSSNINCIAWRTGSEDALQGKVRLAPNPVEQMLQVETPVVLEAKIINVVGVVVRHLDLNAGHHTIPVSDLATGIYLFQYGSTSIKFVKK
jgi:hypothetical protein